MARRRGSANVPASATARYTEAGLSIHKAVLVNRRLCRVFGATSRPALDDEASQALIWGIKQPSKCSAV